MHICTTIKFIGPAHLINNTFDKKQVKFQAKLQPEGNVFDKKT